MIEFNIEKNEINNILIKSLEYYITVNITNIEFKIGEINIEEFNGSLIKLLPDLINDEVEIYKEIKLKKILENNNKEFYIISSKKDNAKTYILDFIKDITKSYKKYLKNIELERKTRYYYNLLKPEREINMNTTNYIYKYDKYELSNNKSFDNIFFDSKKEILNLLDDFIERKNKFKFNAMPHKLGFLLYGPPGTGKTSLIKAIANYTKRHIINISLNNITKNKQLMDIMYNTKIKLKSGKEDDIITNYSQVIFVIEDIDCINSLGEREEGKKYEREDHSSKIDKYIGRDDGDELDLSGLLNILDGIIDTPNRLIIITTNYKKNIDSALFRPGRINREILMDYINYSNFNKMINYYYGKNLNRKEIKKIIESKKISPAKIEQLCLECDNINSLYKKIINFEK